MTVEGVELVWTTILEYIGAKDRQLAADHLASELVDVLDEEDLKYLAGLDSYMKSAMLEHIEEPEDEYDEYDE